MQKNDFAFELEENAKDSLRHGLEHLVNDGSSADLKQAILSVFHALELFLKARLAREHWTLIFEKPEDANIPDARTISYGKVVSRLKAAGALSDKTDTCALDGLQLVRNRLEHYRHEGSQQEAKDFVGKTAGFLRRFISEDWNVFLGMDLARESEEMILAYYERLESALMRVSTLMHLDPMEGPWPYECLSCGEHTVPMANPESKDRDTQCQFCGEEWFEVRCDRCGGSCLSADRKGDLCEGCLNYYRNQD